MTQPAAPGRFEDIMADRLLNLFFNQILLKVNLKPLDGFIQERSRYTSLDPLEIPVLQQMLHDPVVGPICEVQQWRFKDKPYMFAFKGWRVDQYPEPDQKALWDTYEGVYQEFREYEKHGSGLVNIADLQRLHTELDTLYDEVGREIDPRLKKIWLENNIRQYEGYEGKTEGLPGRLTPVFVDERLRELRAYRVRFMRDLEGMVEYTTMDPPSRN